MRAEVVVIELAALNELKPVADVEAVGVAFFEGAHSYCGCGCVRLCEHLPKHGSTNALPLNGRLDVQVIQQQAIAGGFDDHEADLAAGDLDVVCA